jgi:hypothetical protein
MTIRVLRLLEYEYPDIETADADMGHWYMPANGSRVLAKLVTIRSAIILNPFGKERDEPTLTPPLHVPSDTDEFPKMTQPGDKLVTNPASHRKTS